MVKVGWSTMLLMLFILYDLLGEQLDETDACVEELQDEE